MVPFVERAGIELLEWGENDTESTGIVKLKLPFRGNENHVGTMYAGSLWTVAEFAGLPFCLSAFGDDLLERFLPVVAQFNIKFYKPVKCDVFVTVSRDFEWCEEQENELLHEGKLKVTLNTKIVDAEGEEYGETEGVYVIVDNPDSKGSVAAIKAIKDAEYVRTEPPEHNMMELF